MRLWAHLGFDVGASRIIQTFFGMPQVRALLSSQFAIRYCEPAEVADALAAGQGAAFVSEETFLAAGWPADAAASSRIAGRFGELGREAELGAVFLLMRQDLFLENLYQMRLREGETRHFREFVEAIPWPSLDWNAALDRVADIVGRENVIVVPCEPAVLAGAGWANYLEALLAALGVPLKIDLASIPGPRGFSPRAAEIVRTANQCLPEDEAAQVRAWLEVSVPLAASEPCDCFAASERRELLARFAPSNKRLFERFAPHLDGRLYLAE